MPPIDIKEENSLKEKGKKLTQEINALEVERNKLKGEGSKLTEKELKLLKETKQQLVDNHKKQEQINAEKTRQADIEKELNDIHGDILDKLKNQPQFIKKIANENNGILAIETNLSEIRKLEIKGAKNLTTIKKKELKMRKDSSTIISDILGNTQSIGTEEFSTYNMTKLINYARSEGHGTLLDDLLLYKKKLFKTQLGNKIDF